jgi:hypothetical protein
LHLIRRGGFFFDEIPSATIIQHVGERVATQRNLMIGNAQILRKYAADIAKHHGIGYLARRRGQALAGLWSVGEFKHGTLLQPVERSFSSEIATWLRGMGCLPGRLLVVLNRRVKMVVVRFVL